MIDNERKGGGHGCDGTQDVKGSGINQQEIDTDIERQR